MAEAMPDPPDLAAIAATVTEAAPRVDPTADPVEAGRRACGPRRRRGTPPPRRPPSRDPTGDRGQAEASPTSRPRPTSASRPPRNRRGRGAGRCRARLRRRRGRGRLVQRRPRRRRRPDEAGRRTADSPGRRRGRRRAPADARAASESRPGWSSSGSSASPASPPSSAASAACRASRPSASHPAPTASSSSPSSHDAGLGLADAIMAPARLRRHASPTRPPTASRSPPTTPTPATDRHRSPRSRPRGPSRRHRRPSAERVHPGLRRSCCMAGFEVIEVEDPRELEEALEARQDVALAILDGEIDPDEAQRLRGRPARRRPADRGPDRRLAAGARAARRHRDRRLAERVLHPPLLRRLDPLAGRGDVHPARDRRRRQRAGPARAATFGSGGWSGRATTIAVFNPKGGVGKTTVATNLAVGAPDPQGQVGPADRRRHRDRPRHVVARHRRRPDGRRQLARRGRGRAGRDAVRHRRGARVRACTSSR